MLMFFLLLLFDCMLLSFCSRNYASLKQQVLYAHLLIDARYLFVAHALRFTSVGSYRTRWFQYHPAHDTFGLSSLSKNVRTKLESIGSGVSQASYQSMS